MHAVFYYTLGCKLNYSETSTYQRQFEAAGCTTVKEPQEATICVLNSCAVTEQAQKKCRQELHKIRRAQPNAFIVLVGCYADLMLKEAQIIDTVDLVVARHDKRRLADLVLGVLAGENYTTSCTAGTENYFPAFSKGGRTRAFLKIQDGCNYRCTYCAIPQARGESRSATIAEVLEQVHAIADAGILEVVITGVNTGDFGRAQRERFIDLLRALDAVEAIARYRISSLEPNLLSNELIDFVASSRAFLPHFHIPLQSGSDTVLRAMGRRYTTQHYAERIEKARECIKSPFLGVDLIVGFPGESDADFDATYRFLEGIAPSFLHLFPYSRRPGTPAASYPRQVPAAVTKQRMERLMRLNTSLQGRYAHAFVATQKNVLVERISSDGIAEGHTENYLHTKFRAKKAQHATIVPVLLTEYSVDGYMVGEEL
jgi:MiaB-like protein